MPSAPFIGTSARFAVLAFGTFGTIRRFGTIVYLCPFDLNRAREEGRNFWHDLLFKPFDRSGPAKFAKILATFIFGSTWSTLDLSGKCEGRSILLWVAHWCHEPVKTASGRTSS